MRNSVLNGTKQEPVQKVYDGRTEYQIVKEQREIELHHKKIENLQNMLRKQQLEEKRKQDKKLAAQALKNELKT